VQDLRKSVLLQLIAQRRLFEIVGKQIFHAAEAGSLGRGKRSRNGSSPKSIVRLAANFGMPDILGLPGWGVYQSGLNLPLRPAQACLVASHPGSPVRRQAGDRESPSNSTMLSISVPIAMLVHRVRG